MTYLKANGKETGVGKYIRTQRLDNPIQYIPLAILLKDPSQNHPHHPVLFPAKVTLRLLFLLATCDVRAAEKARSHITKAN